jgi:hypothetical protein
MCSGCVRDFNPGAIKGSALKSSLLAESVPDAGGVDDGAGFTGLGASLLECRRLRHVITNSTRHDGRSITASRAALL